MIKTMPSIPGGPVLTRRRAIQAMAGVGVALAAPLTLSTPTAAAPAAPTPLHALPQRFGTPTDLARRSKAQIWTRQPNGTVVTYDKKLGVWVPAPHQVWSTVLTFGTVVLARWAKPSGHDQLVLVIGPTSVTLGSTTSSTARSRTTSNATSTSHSGSTTTAATTGSASPAPATGGHTHGGTGLHNPPSPAPGLADTGFPTTSPVAWALSAILAGAGLTFLRRRQALTAAKAQTERSSTKSLPRQ